MIDYIRGQQYSAYRVLMYVMLLLRKGKINQGANVYNIIFEKYVKNIFSGD